MKNLSTYEIKQQIPLQRIQFAQKFFEVVALFVFFVCIVCLVRQCILNPL